MVLVSPPSEEEHTRSLMAIGPAAGAMNFYEGISGNHIK